MRRSGARCCAGWSATPRPGGTLVAGGGPGEASPCAAAVSDSAFLRANGATVGTVTTPPVSHSQWRWNGRWSRMASIAPRTCPMASGARGAAALDRRAGHGAGRTGIRAGSALHERSTSGPSFGRRCCGRWPRNRWTLLPAARALDVAEDMVYSPSGATVVEQQDLWDMPALLVVLLAALGARSGRCVDVGGGMMRMRPARKCTTGARGGNVGLGAPAPCSHKTRRHARPSSSSLASAASPQPARGLHGWAVAVAQAATTRFGVPDSLVVLLARFLACPCVQGRSTRKRHAPHRTAGRKLEGRRPPRHPALRPQ
jgi:hypothetical protein